MIMHIAQTKPLFIDRNTFIELFRLPKIGILCKSLNFFLQVLATDFSYLP